MLNFLHKKILYLIILQCFITAQLVTYHDQEGIQANGYLSIPKNSKQSPALILIHEWWGLNEDIIAKTKKYSELGYVALAVDLYGGKNTDKPQEAMILARGVRSNMSNAFDNLSSAISFLKNHQNVDSTKIASVGWCFGGGWSYQIAKNDLGIKASVIYYGQFNPKDDLAKMRASILGHFAEEDRSISIDNVKEFKIKLESLSNSHEIYIYPNTTHGFASREGNNPRYKKEAASLAWDRTNNFLTQALGQDTK